MRPFPPLAVPGDETDRLAAFETEAMPRSAQSARSVLRAEAYLALAKQSAQLAEDSDLPQVRRKHELAAGIWLQLADVEGRPSLSPAAAG